MGTALNNFDLIGCVFLGTAWGAAFPNIRAVWSEVSTLGSGLAHSPLGGSGLVWANPALLLPTVPCCRRRCFRAASIARRRFCLARVASLWLPPCRYVWLLPAAACIFSRRSRSFISFVWVSPSLLACSVFPPLVRWYLLLLFWSVLTPLIGP